MIRDLVTVAEKILAEKAKKPETEVNPPTTGTATTITVSGSMTNVPDVPVKLEGTWS